MFRPSQGDLQSEPARGTFDLVNEKHELHWGSMSFQNHRGAWATTRIKELSTLSRRS